MKLSTQGRYVVTAMPDPAWHDAAGPVCLGAAAGRRHISQPRKPAVQS